MQFSLTFPKAPSFREGGTSEGDCVTQTTLAFPNPGIYATIAPQCAPWRCNQYTKDLQFVKQQTCSSPPHPLVGASCWRCWDCRSR